MESVSLRLPPELKKALCRLAEECQTTPGHIARLLITPALEKAVSSGTPVFALPENLTSTT